MRTSDALSCPSEEELKGSVAERLGYDPFESSALQSVEARIGKERGGYVATVSFRGADGVVRSREPLFSAANDCKEIVSSLALAISIAIDPLSFVRAAPTPQEATDAEKGQTHRPSKRASAEPTPLVSELSRDAHDRSAFRKEEKKMQKTPTHVRWRGGLGAMGSVGALPGPSFGPLGAFGVKVQDFGVTAEGRFDFPASKAGPSGSTIRASLLLATLAPCWEKRFLSVCGLFSLGQLSGRGSGVDIPREDRSLYAAAGGRVGVELPMGGLFRGRFQFDVAAPLQKTTLRIDASDAWTTPSVFATTSFVATWGTP